MEQDFINGLVNVNVQSAKAILTDIVNSNSPYTQLTWNSQGLHWDNQNISILLSFFTLKGENFLQTRKFSFIFQEAGSIVRDDGKGSFALINKSFWVPLTFNSKKQAAIDNAYGENYYATAVYYEGNVGGNTDLKVYYYPWGQGNQRCSYLIITNLPVVDVLFHGIYYNLTEEQAKILLTYFNEASDIKDPTIMYQRPLMILQTNKPDTTASYPAYVGCLHATSGRSAAFAYHRRMINTICAYEDIAISGDFNLEPEHFPVNPKTGTLDQIGRFNLIATADVTRRKNYTDTESPLEVITFKDEDQSISKPRTINKNDNLLPQGALLDYSITDHFSLSPIGPYNILSYMSINSGNINDSDHMMTGFMWAQPKIIFKKNRSIRLNQLKVTTLSSQLFLANEDPMYQVVYQTLLETAKNMEMIQLVKNEEIQLLPKKKTPKKSSTKKKTASNVGLSGAQNNNQEDNGDDIQKKLKTEN